MIPQPALDPFPTDTSLTTWLKAVLWGAFLLPTLIFLIAAGFSYERAYDGARESVMRASALSLRHAERTLQIASDIAHRVDDAVSGSDADIRLREASLHQRLADLSAGLPSLVNVNVYDSNGRPLVRSDVYPADRDASVADRSYFIEQREHERPLGISEVLRGRQTGRELVNATIRRRSSDGSFTGVVVVSMSPEFFRDYYRTLSAEQPELAIFTLVRTDGTFMARWPPRVDERASVRPDNPILTRIQAGDESGFFQLMSTDGVPQSRLVSFRRVPDFPVYVTAGVARNALLAGWLRSVLSLAAIYIPTTLGLVLVSWLALRKTRRELMLGSALQEQISRRATAEQAMLEAQKLEALSQVTGGVAHDFNNLLTILSTSLHVLRRGHPELTANRHVESMARAVKSGVGLTRQLLSFSRKQALRPQTIALQHWLPASTDLLQTTLGRNVKLGFEVAAGTWPITVDTAELELALINVVLNARHAMPSGGSLQIDARNGVDPVMPDAERVVLRVVDDGVGIPEDILNRVFEPFFTTKGAGKGTGLGLSQVFGLCAQSGGTATVQSVVGQGTTISLFFPRAVEAVNETDVAEPVPARQLTGRVLLVEDNDAVASVTESLLRASGLDVVRVGDADAALAAVESGLRADMVFSDISMPGSIDGIGLAFALRERWPELPVLLTTGYAARIEEAVAAGFHVLNKPAPPDAIVQQIAALIASMQA